MATTAEGASRFELAPPRRFILPAVLLLLTERPGYGYGLVPELERLCIGHVDRPAVYRALAQLERDGLVEASSANPKAGQSRRVYRVTPLGQRVLRAWMGVVNEEHDYLGQVLRRYRATGTADALLSEVEAGWSSALGAGGSPVAPNATVWRQPVRADDRRASGIPPPAPSRVPTATPPETGLATRSGCFRILPERSAILVEVRSTVGPLTFGAMGLSGSVVASAVASVDGGNFGPSGASGAAGPPGAGGAGGPPGAGAGEINSGAVPTGAPLGRLVVDVSALGSGNPLYDAELLRRIDARRYPTAVVELLGCTPATPGRSCHASGELTLHGVTRPISGTVYVEQLDGGILSVTGHHVFDIRDFAIPSPTVLMLRIYPDVRVKLHAEARWVANTEPGADAEPTPICSPRSRFGESPEEGGAAR